jgi:hypothetical protein
MPRRLDYERREPECVPAGADRLDRSLFVALVIWVAVVLYVIASAMGLLRAVADPW